MWAIVISFESGCAVIAVGAGPHVSLGVLFLGPDDEFYVSENLTQCVVIFDRVIAANCHSGIDEYEVRAMHELFWYLDVFRIVHVDL